MQGIGLAAEAFDMKLMHSIMCHSPAVCTVLLPKHDVGRGLFPL